MIATTETDHHLAPPLKPRAKRIPLPQERARKPRARYVNQPSTTEWSGRRRP